MNLRRAAVVAALVLPVGAMAMDLNDLREFHVGMPVAELPSSGYGGFSCAADPSKTLPGWQDYRSCPAGPDGNRAIGFRYDNEDGDKTQVGGQPVKLALLINNNAHVAGISIDTDPNARLYMHKKAFLFALQVRARFGEDGWTCQKAAPTPTEQPVGGVFIHEHCDKATGSRHFVLDRELFRDPTKDLKDFTDATQLTILSSG